MNAGLGTHAWLTVEVSASSHRQLREIRLVCENGVAWLADAPYGHIGIGQAPFEGEPRWLEISGEMPLLSQLRAFVEHLAGGPPLRSSAAEGAETVARIAELRALATHEEAQRGAPA